MSVRVDAADAPWLRLLSRWALATALLVIALMLIYMIGIGLDDAVPIEQSELMGAARSPAIYRVAQGLDILVWLGIGGVLLLFAAAFGPRAPIRALFLGACGISQVVGALGGFLRLNAIGELATRYSESQDTLRQVYPTVWQVISAHFNTGQLLYGAGYLIIASVALSSAAVPRWIGLLFALSGLYAVGNQVWVIATGAFLPDMVFLLFQVVDIVLYIAIAAVFWRRTVAGSQRLERAPAA